MNRVEGTGAVLQRINALEIAILELELVEPESCSQGDWYRNRMLLHAYQDDLTVQRQLLTKLQG